MLQYIFAELLYMERSGLGGATNPEGEWEKSSGRHTICLYSSGPRSHM